MIDLSKLQIIDGVIHYKVRAQDGSFIQMTVRDSREACLFVSWVQIHD